MEKFEDIRESVEMSLGRLFKKAEQYGIKRGRIGAHVFGKKNYATIYRLKNPTAKTIGRIAEAVEFLIVEKNKVNKVV